MSRPAVAASVSLPFELVIEDGIPMENNLHVIQFSVLRDLVDGVMKDREREDYFTAGNIFVYYSIEQAHDVAKGGSYFRGPDFFLVTGVPPKPVREAWVSWEEGGRLPDLIVELLSPSTADIDRTEKKDLYARVFRTPEYYLYDFDTEELEGFRLAGNVYKPMRRDSQGRYRSEVLGLDIGLWRGVLKRQKAEWIRFFHPDGRLVPTPEERAEAERQRAEAAEAELRRLRAQLQDPPHD
ncbi:MAG TPA: Uma2 family endonuclease [Thermoanaerobaculia bacterium]